MKLAVQLYTLREDYSNGEEFLEILEKVTALSLQAMQDLNQRLSRRSSMSLDSSQSDAICVLKTMRAKSSRSL